jgi:hypothetical protein
MPLVLMAEVGVLDADTRLGTLNFPSSAESKPLQTGVSFFPPQVFKGNPGTSGM